MLDVVHGSLGPGDFVWFLPDFTCKIIDFDGARFAGEEAIPDIPLSTMADLKYAAPEVICSANRRQKLRFGTACDIWSAGVIAHELFTGTISLHPYRQALYLSSAGKQYYGELSNPGNIVEVSASQEPLPVIYCKNRRVRSFLKRVLRMDPSKRPVASVALNHDVLRSSGTSPLDQVEISEATPLPFPTPLS